MGKHEALFFPTTAFPGATLGQCRRLDWADGTQPMAGPEWWCRGGMRTTQLAQTAVAARTQGAEVGRARDPDGDALSTRACCERLCSVL
jgi:hypothetical protein